MPIPWTPIFSTILRSSINLPAVPAEARWLWITMLLLANDIGEDGSVDIPVPRLAYEAGLTDEATAAALHILESPDPMSGSQAEEGRRLIRLRPETPLRPKWQIVNWHEYQNLFRKVRNQEMTRIRMRDLRALRKGSDDSPPEAASPPSSPADGTGQRSRKSRKKTGTPMSPDWQPSPELAAAMQTECPGVDVKRQVPVFRDYWIGEGKIKADWSATFRNWIRRTDGYQRQRGGIDRRPAQSDSRESQKSRGMRAKDFGLRTLADFDAEVPRSVL